MSIVSVKDLKKNYGGFWAVNGISFEIEQGEVFGFLGPNGAGKTSTINMLIGLSRPSEGSVTIDGTDAVKYTKRAQRVIGIVPDESSLYDELDAFSNLCFCGGLYGMRKREREAKARELLERFSLSATGRKPFGAFSKGMKRRLTIAAALMHDPKILFLDEPTTGIDVESARQIRVLVSELKQKGCTVFLTTHYIEEAERLCDRIAFIAGGRIAGTGTVDELMENADKEHIIRLSCDAFPEGIIEECKKAFKEIRVEGRNGNECVIISKKRIPLSSILSFFDGKGVSVFEAKEMRPTLEDVFVKVTGIEAGRLEKEKEAQK